MQLERNSLDGALLDSLHHVGGEPYRRRLILRKVEEVRVLTSNLISESLRLDDRDVVDDTLVGVEVTGKSNRTSLLPSKAYFP